MYVCVVYFRPEFAKFKQEEISNVTNSRTYIKNTRLTQVHKNKITNKNVNVAAVIRLTRTTEKAQKKDALY